MFACQDGALQQPPTITTYKAVDRGDREPAVQLRRSAQTMATAGRQGSEPAPPSEPASLKNIKRLSLNEEVVSVPWVFLVTSAFRNLLCVGLGVNLFSSCCGEFFWLRLLSEIYSVQHRKWISFKLFWVFFLFFVFHLCEMVVSVPWVFLVTSAFRNLQCAA